MDSFEIERTEGDGEGKERGFWLSTILILMLIVNALTAFVYFSNLDAIANSYPRATIELAYFMGFMCVANVFFTGSIWAWKKVGVFGFYSAVMLAFTINIYLGLDFLSSLAGLLGGLMIYAATKNKWQYFA